MKRTCVGVLICVVAVSALGGTAVGADPTMTAGHGPPASAAYAGDFPDPSVLAADDGYWAYSTGSAGRNLQVMHSPELTDWSDPVDPLPVLPDWAARGHTWAPSVARIGARYVMYYTVRHASAGRQCISVATSDTPRGPFRDDRDEPLICQLERFGSIDPAVFSDRGTLYLLWKSDDNAGGRPTSLWAQPLSEDGLSLLGEPTRLLTQAHPWQNGIIEGPAMVTTERGYLLFYGAADWSTALAGIGYATCETPLGPCTDRSTHRPWLGATTGALGPAGPAPFLGRDGILRLAYHAWTQAVGYDNGGTRSLFIASLAIDRRGRPVAV
jgi:hypothetical protein